MPKLASNSEEADVVRIPAAPRMIALDEEVTEREEEVTETAEPTPGIIYIY